MSSYYCKNEGILPFGRSSETGRTMAGSKLQLFSIWWHLVAFIVHYTHLYEIVRHQLSHMQLYNTQHAYNLLHKTRYFHSCTSMFRCSSMEILSIQLYKNFNDKNHGETWTDLNFQQHYGGRINHVLIHDSSRIKLGQNIIINRLNVLNGKIEYYWLNLSLD